MNNAASNTANPLNNNTYKYFLQWADTRGLDFPCTNQQFINRAVAFAQGDANMVDALCKQGIGPNWNDD